MATDNPRTERTSALSTRTSHAGTEEQRGFHANRARAAREAATRRSQCEADSSNASNASYAQGTRGIQCVHAQATQAKTGIKCEYDDCFLQQHSGGLSQQSESFCME
ncbi:hypothetical protein IAQ61_010225 [Plenodomus lingam]|uniref:uncharacterized protein n=1 Tax=Leptosphaeria maculans TaxID=5022 RepID=UPI00331B1D2E|nr:hypothetical protein IAQ61_010225 [Plenodomus lingam]